MKWSNVFDEAHLELYVFTPVRINLCTAFNMLFTFCHCHLSCDIVLNCVNITLFCKRNVNLYYKWNISSLFHFKHWVTCDQHNFKTYQNNYNTIHGLTWHLLRGVMYSWRFHHWNVMFSSRKKDCCMWVQTCSSSVSSECLLMKL